MRQPRAELLVDRREVSGRARFRVLPLRGCRPESFEQMIASWFPLTYLLNNLNRGLGLPDGYPFVLSPPAIDKLRFVHEAVAAAAP